ncbi:MAG: hypothetical protein M3Q19_02435 [Pseudomonadota bacterium]|nr:hypothetical protein [Pseudomonadota bacterium]
MRFLLILVLAALGLAPPANAAWHEAKSKHFIIYADLKPNELRAYAERLERFDQAARKVRGMDDPPLTDSQRLTVFALRSEGAVERLASRGSGVRGFYESRASGNFAFVPRRAGSSSVDWDLDAQEIFFHEYAHHLQLQFASVALPPWVIEGFAEFFATAKIEKNGDVLIGAPPQYRAYGLFTTEGLSLEQMVGVTYAKLNDEKTDLLYGMGWLLTHYLSFEPSRRGQLSRYIDAIQKGEAAASAAEAAFGDLKALDRELERYKRGRLSALRVNGATLALGNIAIRQLGAGEAAIMDVRTRSKRGVDEKTAPIVAADARKTAAPYADDPAVQSALAEAEYDAGNFAAADAAADRALAKDPNHVHALIYKGRARMELAKAAKQANWKEARGWFSRANKLDTENAEPLMLFYQSFAESGERPTSNAIEALLYSVVLAPQDEGLRFNAVRQLLTDGRVAEAKTMFGPLAFQPHAPAAMREISAKVMAAMSAGDSKGALLVLDTAGQAAEEAEKPKG